MSDHLKFAPGKPVIEPDLRERIVAESIAQGIEPGAAEEHADLMMQQLLSAKVWLSPLYQVHIVSERDVIHYNLKRRDRAPLMSRAHLVDIGQHFCRDRQRVPVEVYPMQSCVVDMANQYHVWAPPIRRAKASAMIRLALESPGKALDIHGGERVLHLPIGETRDWREVQDVKSKLLGVDTDAIDLLLPETREIGPVLYAFAPGQALPFGWRGGMQSDTGSSTLGAVQRPLAGS